MNRKGKVACLPLELRQGINTRLRDGETGGSLVAWLNGLPEVQAVMAAEFEGAPIREQNITEWRRGGYLDWLDAEDSFEVVHRLRDGGAEFQEDEKEEEADLGKAMEYYLSSRNALATKRAGALEGKEKWALWQRMCLEVARLRQGDIQAGQLELAEERLAWREEIETERHAAAPAERAWEAKYRARAAAKRRGEFTEEELAEGKAETDAIFKSETEEQAEYYRKLRHDAMDADALARGERLPDHDYELVWNPGPEQPYPASRYGPGSPYRYQKTHQCMERERKERQVAALKGERLLPKPKPYWSPTGFPEDGEPVQDWQWKLPGDVTPEAEPAAAPATSTEAATPGGQPAAAPPAAAAAPAAEAPPEKPAPRETVLERYYRTHGRPRGWRPPRPYR